MIVILAVIALIRAYKIGQDEKQGLPIEDELSTFIKYKAGYYSFLISIYMWLAIFLLKNNFSNVETMLGVGILLSGFLSVIVKFVVRDCSEIT